VDPLTIRPAQAAELAAILAINAQGRPGVSALTQAELDALVQEGPHLYVAMLGLSVVGYTIVYTDASAYDGEEFSWFKRRFAGFLYIDQIAIAESARRARVGTQIYRFLDQLARERELASIVCEVNLAPPNPASLAFHANNGFVEVGMMETGDGRRVSLRRKELRK
jgi:predicted GNAT superfamily acetyltransferase